jgi:hypothetical protein
MNIATRVRGAIFAATLVSNWLAASSAHAGGPRFVTGTNYQTGYIGGQSMAFYTPNVLYYTDPGNLNASVTHAQADAMVAAAAAPWNVSVALLTLAQGGTLNQHVSDQNSYFTGTSFVFPADVQASNYLSKPIAVIYDTDGSVTDMLLGSGASDPTACRHNAVTESVDGFGTETIQHAVILLNGRCVGSTPQQLLQMQYQLERVFGRVLGLAWAQVNDNVFTVATPVTAGQAQNWPVMHPIDVICGTYTYQCMQEPFQLRPDDISSLALLYPVTADNIVPGKTLTIAADSVSVEPVLYFPDAQQGMDSVNLVIQWGVSDRFLNSFQTVAAVSGANYQRNGGNPVTERIVPQSDAAGAPYNGWDEGVAMMGRLPLDFSTGLPNWALISVEPINPLYSGEYAIGIYEGSPLSMTGTAWVPNGWFETGNWNWEFNMLSLNEPPNCNPGNDGVEYIPVPIDPSGWWTNLLCGPGHVSWLSATVKPGRTWTLETTATDESGAASVQKMRPMIGVWSSTDGYGGLPDIAASPWPMNSLSLGMTQLPVSAASEAQTVRIAIADSLGAGRPDFTYNARMLYADSISPAIVGSGGGQITITGMGFRAGNQVTVNGVPATVTNWTSTQIVAMVPTMSAAKLKAGVAADVAVIDASTTGSTVMTAALSYSGAADTMKLVSAPVSLDTGVVSGTPFAVRVYASDGIAPISGASVKLTVSGVAALTACGNASSCIVTTDTTGLAQTAVTGTAIGVAVLTATEMSGGANVSVTIIDANPIRAVTAASPVRYVAAGASVLWTDAIAVTQDGLAVANVPVSWSTTTGLSLATSQTMTDATGTASIDVQTNALAADTTTVVTGCAWSTICASITAYGVAAPLWTAAIASGAGQSVNKTQTLTPVTLQITDGSGHPLQGATVQVYQTVDAWEGVCPAHGACPSAPVLTKATTTATSDANGNITVTPLQVPGVPQVVNLAASTGTQGFVSLSLVVAP